LNKIQLLFLGVLLLLASCGPEHERAGIQNQPNTQISRQYTQEQKDYIDRFNTVVKDIRDFPPKTKNFEKYFHAFKSVTKIEDAEIIFFGETHSHSANQIWSAGLINHLLSKGDVALFEGAQSGTKVVDVAEHFTTGIFAAREFEKTKSHKGYKPISISKLEIKYQGLFFDTKDALAFDVIKLDQLKGYFWDLTQGSSLHPDGKLRNKTMIETIENYRKPGRKVFIIAGALHLPHYEFAFLLSIDAALRGALGVVPNIAPTINDAFFVHAPFAETKVIFDYLKNKKFAVLIPKNIPGLDQRSAYLPGNAI
jgi:hypothetical protein